MTNVRVENLVVQYGNVRVLHGIGFTAEQGEFVTLLGPSGCGKTTSLRCIAGLERPASGVIEIGGNIVCGNGVFVPIRQRNIGMVFQSYAIWPHMSVKDNVGFPLRIRKLPTQVKRERVEHALELVGLAAYGDRYPHELSGGQQQRVALARAIVYDPDVLLLDEPLSNLDAKLREQMRDELRALQQRLRLTTIYVTHDQAEAMTLSDKIIVMNSGRIDQVGTALDIYQSPQTQFVRNFVGFVNELPARVARKRDDGLVEVELPFGTLVTCACTLVDAQPEDEVRVWIRPEDLRVARNFTPETENVVTAQVMKTAFQGNWTEYWLELGGAVVRAAGSQCDLFSPGERILCQFPPERLRVTRD
jgi:iron(III) transport system ATP-binding protein